MTKTIIFLGLWLVFLAGCTSTTGNEPEATVTAVPPNSTASPSPTTPTAVPAAQDTPAPSPTEFPTMTPPPPPAAPILPQLLLGDVRQLGRGQLLDAAFLPSGDSFVIALGWATGVSLATLEGQELWRRPSDARPIALAADRQGAHIAAILESGAVVVYSADTGDIQQTADSPPDVNQSALAFSPDGRWLAFQSVGPNRGDPIFLLDVASGVVSEIPHSTINRNARPFLVWSPDSETITLSTLGQNWGERCIHLLDATSGAERLILQSDAGCYLEWALAFAPDGAQPAAQAALAHPEGGVDLLQLDSGQVAAHLTGDLLIHSQRTAPSLLFAPDGRWLATGGGYFQDTIYPTRVWDGATGAIVAELLLKRPPSGAPTGAPSGGELLTLTFADDALLAVYSDGRITRWPFTDEEAAEEAVGQLPVIAPYLDLRWSADGTRFTAPLTFGGAAVWDVGQNEAIALFPAPLIRPALSPDGRWLALFHPQQREIQLYEVDSGALVANFADTDTLPAGDPFSPDGRWLAYSAGNQLQLTRIDGEETAVLLEGYREDQTINRVLWSPASDALVVASLNPSATSGQIILWEAAEDGGFVAAYQGESVRTGYATIAAFSPQGRYAAFEILLDVEIGLVVEVVDRQGGTAVLRAERHELLAWLADDLLLTFEQSSRQFAQWEVETGHAAVSTQGPIGSELFAPTGGFYAYPANTGPDTGRAVRVDHWERQGSPQEYHVGSSIRALRWSPDGRWLTALASDGSLWLWSANLPNP